MTDRPHVVGIDDGPFDRTVDTHADVVAVMTEGSDLVEAVALSRFPLDGDDVTGFLVRWLGELRSTPAAQAVMLGGITLAGLGIVDVKALSHRIGRPVLVANRREPSAVPLRHALRSAGLESRIPLVEETPPSRRLDGGVWIAHAGTSDDQALRLAAATIGKSRMPEPLRLAHLIAGAVARGESKGRP